MRYFDLSDDVHVPDRWYLGEMFDRGSNESLELCEAEKAPHGVSLCLEITHSGMALDFCLTSFAVPIARVNLANAIALNACKDIERHPLEINGYQGSQDFEVLNAVLSIKCLDEKRSEYTKWTKSDHRADLAGKYRMVTKLKLDTALIPKDAHFFRIEGWRIALIVSEHVKSSMQTFGCLGAKFEDVT